MNQKILAESENYRIVHEFENVSVELKKENKVSIPIGDFYGEPICAMISLDETYAVIGGYGLVIYFFTDKIRNLPIKPSFLPQIELFNKSDDVWEIETIYQSANDEYLNQNFLEHFRMVVEKDQKVSVYRLNVLTLLYEKISE